VSGDVTGARQDRDVDWDAQGDRYARTRHHITHTAAYEAAVADTLAEAPPGPVVDVGAGTGIWSPLLARWTRRAVVAVEPEPGMRRHATAEHAAGVHHVAGRVPDLPLRAASGSGAWLSAVLHHVGDLRACARELRRALAPGAPVLIRGAFAGRADTLPQVRYFPEVRRRFDRYPTIEATEAAFGEVGFRRRRLDVVNEHTIDLQEWRRLLPDQRRSDTTLVQLTDDEFAAGLRRIDEDVAAGRTRPVATIDLLVLR
jgi:SAM-dependent methyltransferase